jgi:hypothetical protein
MEIAAVVWIFLLFVAGLAATVIAHPRRVTAGPALTLVPAVEKGPRPRTADEVRYADEVAVAAERAAATAARARDLWESAQEEVDDAWADYQVADAEARRFAAAAAYPVMRRRRAKGENADRERFLHRAAFDACRQREISIAQLNDILAHRGWNERLHPAAQESALRAAVRDHRYDVYLRAAERERVAWAESERAAEALRSLRTEACLATVRATEEDTVSADADWWAQQWAAAGPVRKAEPVRTAEPARAAA